MSDELAVMPVLHVVIPIYNERETLEACVDRIRAAPMPSGWSSDLVLIDDCSDPDAAAQVDALMERRGAAGDSIRLLRHEINRGKGAAIRSGFDAVLKGASDEDAVIIQDADLEYDPADYRDLLQPIIEGRADAVFGTRWGAHHPLRSMTARLHRLGNGALTALSNALTGLRVHDMECCYKVMSIPALRLIRPALTEDRFGVEPQIAAVLARSGQRVEDVPVRYEPRGFSEGKKIGWRDGVNAIQVMLRERRRAEPGAP